MGHQIQAFRYFRFGRLLGSQKSSQNAPNKPPKPSKRYPRGAQERSGAPQESPKSLQKPPPESSQGTLGRPKSLLGWFWEPRGVILEPPGLVLPIFPHFSRPFL